MLNRGVKVRGLEAAQAAIKQKTGSLDPVTWCERRELNPHDLSGHWHLKPARLPFRHVRKNSDNYMSMKLTSQVICVLGVLEQ